MNPERDESERRQALIPECLRDPAAARNPVVAAYLRAYRLGHYTLEEALSGALVVLARQQEQLFGRLAEAARRQPAVTVVDAAGNLAPADEPTVVEGP